MQICVIPHKDHTTKCTTFLLLLLNLSVAKSTKGVSERPEMSSKVVFWRQPTTASESIYRTQKASSQLWIRGEDWGGWIDWKVEAEERMAQLKWAEKRECEGRERERMRFEGEWETDKLKVEKESEPLRALRHRKPFLCWERHFWTEREGNWDEIKEIYKASLVGLLKTCEKGIRLKIKIDI